MRLSRVFFERNIRMNVTAASKKDLFEDLVHFLSVIEQDIDEDEVLKTLQYREEMLSTRVAPGIAIPHTQVKHLDRSVGILAISREGLPYDLPGDEKIKLLMLLVDDEADTIEHLDTLRNFALLAKNPRFVRLIVESESPKEAIAIIRDFETY